MIICLHIVIWFLLYVFCSNTNTAQLAKVVEYTDCILYREVSLPPTKLSNGEAPVLEFEGMWSTLSLALLSDPLFSYLFLPFFSLFLLLISSNDPDLKNVYFLTTISSRKYFVNDKFSLNTFLTLPRICWLYS